MPFKLCKLFFVLVALIGASGTPCFAKANQPALSSEIIQFVELPKHQLAGPVLTNSAIQAPLLLVDFWASWCSPCLKALPFYESLYKKYKTKGLQVVAINLDDDTKARDTFLKKHSLNLPIFADGQPKLYDLFQVQAVPTLYILNKDKKVLKKYLGFGIKEEKEIENLIKQLLL